MIFFFNFESTSAALKGCYTVDEVYLYRIFVQKHDDQTLGMLFFNSPPRYHGEIFFSPPQIFDTGRQMCGDAEAITLSFFPCSCLLIPLMCALLSPDLLQPG